jgi:membrane protein DedA with SNARE-associated domain
MTSHVASLLFAWVLLNQAGVPVPVVPSLMAAGALVAHAHTSLVMPLLVTVSAALVADLLWYGLGRWRGPQTLSMVTRLSRGSATRVDDAAHRFSAHAFAFLFTSRFLPEINPIAAGLAGATRVRLGRYLVIATLSALAWAMLWTGVGYLVGSATRRVSTPFEVTIMVAVVVVAIVAVWAMVRAARRTSAQRYRDRSARPGSGPNR